MIGITVVVGVVFLVLMAYLLTPPGIEESIKDFFKQL